MVVVAAVVTIFEEAPLVAWVALVVYEYRFGDSEGDDEKALEVVVVVAVVVVAIISSENENRIVMKTVNKFKSIFEMNNTWSAAVVDGMINEDGNEYG